MHICSWFSYCGSYSFSIQWVSDRFIYSFHCIIDKGFLNNEIIIQDHPILAAFCYSFTMNSKHLFCFQAPFFLIYLLRTYCLQNNHFRFNHFVQLGLIVLSSILSNSLLLQPFSYLYIPFFEVTFFLIFNSSFLDYSHFNVVLFIVTGHPMYGQCMLVWIRC